MVFLNSECKYFFCPDAFNRRLSFYLTWFSNPNEAEIVFFIHTFYLSAHTYLILPAVFKIFTFFCLCHIR